MKQLSIAALTLILSIVTVINLSASDEQQMFTTAKNGLQMKDEPSQNGKELELIPFGTRVIILEEDGETVTVDGINDSWCKVEWGGKTGWVFGGFLSDDAADTSPEAVSESEFTGEKLCTEISPGDKTGTLSFTIDKSGIFKAECVTDGVVTTSINGTYTLIKKMNTLKFKIKGMAENITTAGIGQRSIKKFTNGIISIYKKKNILYGDIRLPMCTHYKNRELHRNNDGLK